MVRPLQASIRRSQASVTLSGALYPSRRHLQPASPSNTRTTESKGLPATRP
jgi:hypothetical protein